MIFSDPESDPTILTINFTFVLPSCNCVKLHIITRYKLFSEFLLF
jgi:hypothetical protein